MNKIITIYVLFVLLFFSPMTHAKCFYNNKEYSKGDEVGDYVCNDNNKWEKKK